MCSRRESNPHFILRTDLFYPLNYGSKNVFSRTLDLKNNETIHCEACFFKPLSGFGKYRYNRGKIINKYTEPMFNKNGVTAGREGVETIIGPSVKIEGNFICQGGIVIEGEVKGLVSTAGFLEVGDNASVTADVSAKEAKIAGEIRGNLKIEGYLELTSSAKIIGDIEAGSFSVARGAVLKGKCAIAASELKAAKAAKVPANEND